MLAVCTISPPGPPKSEIRNFPKDIRLLVIAGIFGFDIAGNVWQYEDGGQEDQEDGGQEDHLWKRQASRLQALYRSPERQD